MAEVEEEYVKNVGEQKMNDELMEEARDGVHQGDLPISQPGKCRHYDAKHHNQTMHGRHGIKKVRINKMMAWLKQFDSNNQSHRPSNEQHSQACKQIERSNVFMVGRKNPTLDKP